MVAGSLFGLVFVLIESSGRGWTHPWIIVTAVATVLAFVGFLRYESRHPEPFIELRFFRSIPFAASTVTALCVFIVWGAIEIPFSVTFLDPSTVLTALDANNPTARLVLTSSMAAMGPARNRIAVRPDDMPHPVSAYGRSKLAAERLVLAARDRRHVSIVRPPGVYGPGDTRFLALFRSIERGLAPVPPGRTTSVVYGPDCADALVRCAFEDFESGTAFHVEDGEVHTWRSLADHVAHALGKRRSLARLSRSLLKAS